MTSYDTPEQFDWQNPAVQQLIRAVATKNIAKIEAHHIKASAKLLEIAHYYTRCYEGTFDFMLKMATALVRWQSLTPGQAAGVLNCLLNEHRQLQQQTGVIPTPLERHQIRNGEKTLDDVVADRNSWKMPQADLPANLPTVETPGYCILCGAFIGAIGSGIKQTDGGWVCSDRDSCNWRVARIASGNANTGATVKLNPLTGEVTPKDLPQGQYTANIVMPEGNTLAPNGLRVVTPVVHNGTYTIVLNEKGDYRTLRIVDAPEQMGKPQGTQIAQFLSGNDNESNYTGFAFVSGTRVGIWSKFKADSVLAKALDILLTADKEQQADYGQAYAIESNNCWRCGRKLTVPASVNRGLGPICAEKLGY